MRSRSSLLAVLALAGPAAPGCLVTQATYTHGLQRLETRLHDLETNDAQRRRQLDEAVNQATAQVQTLQQQLEQARTQTRNLADLGNRLDGIEDRLRTLAGTLDELRHGLEVANADDSQNRAQTGQRLDALERRTGIAPLVDAAQLPADNAQLLAQARQALDGRDWARARFLAQALMQRAPQDPSADDAELVIARAQLAENRSATAVQELQRLLQNYPTGDAVPEALATLSEAFLNLRMCTEAQRTLRLLIDRHGATTAGQAARSRLEQVRRLPREACAG